ncbi:MAG: hypothetical protein GX897_03925 [Clostridiales bacterium]|jgi:hypothetical protein|nr:hypothetical protein [Clostridiales bacterium]
MNDDVLPTEYTSVPSDVGGYYNTDMGSITVKIVYAVTSGQNVKWLLTSNLSDTPPGTDYYEKDEFNVTADSDTIEIEFSADSVNDVADPVYLLVFIDYIGP